MTKTAQFDSSYDSTLALIGLSCRFPGASSPEQFWHNLANGVESIRQFDDEQLLAAGVDPAALAQPNYVKAGAPLEGIEQFDAAFFGYTPREAETMDPQHRLFLEGCWQALEQAGYDPSRSPGLVGVFAGSAFSAYLRNNLYPHRDLIEALGQLQVDAGNDRDSLASMVSYKLNLKGPAVSVQTFCSTSLVAVHLACQSLLNYECDLALAGGVSLLLPHQQGYLYEEGGILSPDGHCRAFDRQAAGSVMGSGMGVVVLKRLSEALEDGDAIYALVRGSAINNDGSLRVSYSAPGLDGQASVMLAALSYAGVSAESLSYLEAHGTGTRLGDAVELAAMRKAFRAHTQRQQFCAIGSAKPNVGHLDRASGVCGLIKATLALQQQQLPPSLHFEQANEESELASSPFYVNTHLRPWPAGAMPRRAGVSSFGLGGTNAHLILEEAPELEPTPACSRSSHLLLLSARTAQALRQAEVNLAYHLRHHQEQGLADVAYTLQVGRTAFSYRRVVICRTREEAIAALEQEEHQDRWRARVEHRARTVEPGAQQDFSSSLPELPTKEDSAAELASMEALGRSWLAGAKIEWELLYAGERRRRVPLPTYPFERQSYWIPSLQELQGQQYLSQRPASKRPDVADWFYRPAWERIPLSFKDAAEQVVEKHASCLIFMDDCGLGEHMVRRLVLDGYAPIVVYAGTQFAHPNEGIYTIRPGERVDYETLCRQLAAAGQIPCEVVHCWNVTQAEAGIDRAGFEAAQERGFYSLLYLVQALGTRLIEEAVQLTVISSGMQPVTAGDALQPEKATILGACKVIAQEYLNITCRSIDVDWPDAGAGKQALLIDSLMHEITTASSEPVLAYRDGERRVQRYQGERLAAVETLPCRLRHKGVYMITGGLGHVGLSLAAYLVRAVQARLVFVGRTAFPAREEWSNWLASHTAADGTARKIQRIQGLEAMGAEVMLCQADVADTLQMKAVLREAEERFGQLHGVIHAAAITAESAFKTIQYSDRAACEVHFHAKVYGLLALEQVLRSRAVDFCLVFSSLASILGGLGLAAYSAANICMDALIHCYNRGTGTHWISVNWDSWQFQKDTAADIPGATIQPYTMSVQEGIEAFARVLNSTEYNRLVVSSGDLAVRIRQWIMLEDLREDSSKPARQEAPPTLPLNAAAQRTDYERLLRQIWQEVLGLAEVGLADNFFDVGGNSLSGLQVLARMRKSLQVQIPVVALFEAPSINAMLDYLLTPEDEVGQQEQALLLQERRQRARQHSEAGQGDIALIGMSGRFPGAGNIEQFWDNLRQGVESVTFFSDEQLLAAGVPVELLSNPDYVKARPLLPAGLVEGFDAAFFGYSPREAQLLDPQHRLFLECCWEALENAAYNPSCYPGLIGVFGGANISTYLHSLLKQPELVASMQDQISGYQIAIGMDKDSLTTTVSYKLNLRGPSLAVQSFCSTSLVAVHVACQSLRQGESDLALAGGVSVRVPLVEGYLAQPGGQESHDGHCRSFDAQASGTLFGDGVGVVVLKRLSEALQDGDNILAVIKGSAINNDGSLKVSYSAPSVAGQAEVVAQALAVAGVEAESISYVEAHGSGTELGDPIEIASLSKAFGAQTPQVGYCAIGSVKSNVGHLDRAAGVTGLIKTALALQHEQLPLSLHYQSPNPQIDFEHSPFFVNTQLRPWHRGKQPRRAGVNALGMGGTNAHVIVEEAPLLPSSGPARPWHLLLLSARTGRALEQMSHNLAAALRAQPDLSLADVAYTLQVGRSAFVYRRALVCRDQEEAIRLLEQESAEQVWNRQEERTEREVAFLLPEVGEHEVGLALYLYQQEGTFRSRVDRCCTLLQPILGCDLREVLFCIEQPAEGIVSEGSKTTNVDLLTLLEREDYRRTATQAAAERLKRTELAQPALFVIEYALAHLLMQWGIRPSAMLGYDLGEYVAACLSGVFSLADALTLVARRAQLMQESGPAAAIEALMEFMQTIVLNPPAIPCISSVTGTWITAQEATDPVYWARHMGQTTRFAEGAERLLRETEAVLLEVGPGQLLCSLVKQLPACSEERMQAILPIFSTFSTEDTQLSIAVSLLSTLGKLWLAGVTPHWPGFYAHEQRHRVVLPTYPFERQRYWLELNKNDLPATSQSMPDGQQKKIPDITNWFFAPSWKQAAPSQEHNRKAMRTEDCWLVFMDACGIGAQVASQLERRGQQVISVLPSDGFGRLREEVYTVHPARGADYTALLKDLRVRGKYPTSIAHMWAITANNQPGTETAALEDALQHGFYSLLALAQALGNQSEERIAITVISNEMQDVLGNERIRPEKATLIGPCRVIPQEYSNLACRSIDVVLPEAGSWHEEALVRQLVEELTVETAGTVVALRGNRSWIPCFEPVPLAHVESANARLRPGGVYLLTGGLGGIGLAMANYLARTVQARLVLVGRTGLPPREKWLQALASQGEDEGVGRRIRRVLELEAQGAEVLIVQADVTDEAQMQAAVEQALATFGTLHGVLHAAGVPGIGLIQLKTVEQTARVLAAKVQGTLVLERVLRDLPLDFLALFSSITSTTGGGPGQVDYCAANAFLDAYAHSCPRRDKAIAIDWSEWQWNAWENGLTGYGAEAQAYFKENRAYFGITFEEGAEAFQRVLASGLSHVVVSTQDFRAVAEQSKFFTASLVLQRTREQRRGIALHPRPDVTGSYISPGSDLELRIAALWEDVLGVTPVGIHDNFFELGGNSLIGLDLIARLRKVGNAETLAAHVLYEAPTVSSLARYLEQDTTEEVVEERHERGRRRREGLKQLMYEARRVRE